MRPKGLYLGLCVAGTVIPYLKFLPWLGQHGFDLRLFVRELFATQVGAFFGLDVIVSAVVVLVFLHVERKRLRLRLWWTPVVAVFCVGVSLALPLLLFLRELELERAGSAAQSARA